MLLVYILWFLGVVCGFVAAVEIAITIYRICSKNKNVKVHIILAVIFAAICIGCSSIAAISVVQKIVVSDNTVSDLGKAIGENSTAVTANAYQSFIETWNSTIKDDE